MKMKPSFYTFVGLLLSIAFTSTAQTTKTIVLQPGSSGKDAYIVSRGNQQSNNYGGESWLRTAYVTPPGSGHTVQSLVDFAILDSLQNADSLISVMLTMYADPNYTDDDGGQAGVNETGVYAITQNWTEGGVTWANQPSYNFSSPVIIPTNNSYDSIVVDVTNLVEPFFNQGTPFYGFEFIIQATSPTRSMIFCSSDHPNTTWHPKATLTFMETQVNPPTCNDGIQNGDETGIDCGGSSCPPCVVSENGWVFPAGTDITDPIYRSGSVAIGTSDTGTHKLTVDGIIKTREVYVTQDDWADYVFMKNYPLLSLPDLKEYISKNGHLPDIPSQEQVLQHGVHMADMQKKLLAKIEELTLYIIQQDDRIRTLEKRLTKSY